MDSRYERELRERISELKNSVCFRVVGSGTAKTEFCDLVAIHKGELLVIEVKSTKEDRYYLSKMKDENMRKLMSITDIGATPILAVRFKGRGTKKWVIKNLNHFHGKKVTRNMESDIKVP